MMAPHTPSLAFSFLACACALLWGAPHTPSLAFSFLACTCALLGGAPHTPSLAFSLTCKHDDLLVLKHPPEYFLFMLKKKYELTMFIL